MGDGACGAERRVAGAGRSVPRQGAVCRFADVESRIAGPGGASSRRPAQRLRGRRAHGAGGARLKRMRLRTRVLLLTAAFAMTLFAITFFLSSRNLLSAGHPLPGIRAVYSCIALESTPPRVLPAPRGP